jgi:hypothetical protein
MKDGMSGMLQQVRLGQVRKARKSSIIWPPSFPCPFFLNSENNSQMRGHPGGVRWWKNGLRGLFKQVRLGQVREAIKSWKSEALGPSIHLLTCFGQKFERTVFKRTTSSGTRSIDQITFFRNSFFSFKCRSFEKRCFRTFFWISVLSKKLNFERTLNDQTNWTIYKLKNIRLIVLSKIYLFFCSKNTVKPVYNGHPRDSEKVSVVQRLRQSGRYSQFVPIKLLSVL